MPTATNPETGEKVALINGQWTPVEGTATNKSTGEKMALVGGQWQPLDYGEGSKGSGFVGELGRQVGLTGRAIAGGAAQIAEPFTEPVRYLMNKALPGNPIPNIEESTDALLTKAGVPEPQNSLERGVQSAGRFGVGFAGGMGIANKADDLVHGALGLTKQTKAAAPTAQQLKQTAEGAYKAADDAGVVISPDSFQRFAKKITGLTRNAGIDRDIHPKAAAAVRRIQDAAETGQPLSLQEFEILRRVVSGARGSIEKDERRIGQLIANKLDDYMSHLGRKDVLAGDPKAAGAALKTARDAWTRMSKSETIQEAIEKAGVRAGQFSGSGFENALRTQFRQIAMNNKRMRGFSSEEQAAIKKVAMGGPLDNAMRMLGKFAPTGIVSSGMSGGIGYAIGGPVGAVTLPAVGLAGRQAATKMTERNVEKLSEMVRSGKPLPKDIPEWMLPWLSGGMFATDTQ